MNKVLIQRTLLILFCGTLLSLAGWSGLKVWTLSHQRAEIKRDYSLLNNISFGLLSVNAWRDHIVAVVSRRIDDFELTPTQDTILKHEISRILHAIINKADSMLQKKQKTLGTKLGKFAIRTFVSEDKLHAKVPIFAQTIVDEIKKPATKEKLKELIQSKLTQFGAITYDSLNDVKRVETILHKYDAKDIASFNIICHSKLEGLQERTYYYTFIVLTIMIFFLVLWWLVKDLKELHTPLFIISAMLALTVLFIGLTTPMIEIDARIKEMTFIILGENISFQDQVLFFQSKSIIDVVMILIETKKFDSAFVGILILIFSIVFPIGKMLATKAYLLGNARWRANKLIQFFAFKSGKWSMADVMVVAIFMAYIGFKGILDSELDGLNMKTESMASISTNQTSLQPGFILFVAFVLFGLILSVILQRITKGQTETSGVNEKKASHEALNIIQTAKIKIKNF